MLEVLNTSLTHVFNQIKDRKILSLHQKIVRDIGRLNLNKYCPYHEVIGYNMNECRDFLRQLWKLYKNGGLDEFVNRPQKNSNQQQQGEEAPGRATNLLKERVLFLCAVSFKCNIYFHGKSHICSRANL